MLTSVLIFVSASPIFDISSKLIVSSVVLFIIYLINSSDVFVGKRSLFVLAVLLFILIAYGFVLDLIISIDFSYQGFGFALFIFLGFLLAQKVSRADFLSANEKIVKLSLAIGLPIFIFLQMFPELIQFGLNYTYGNFTGKTFVFLNVLGSEENFISRFTGFGSEPGLTQIFYLLALFSRLSRNGGRIDFFLFFVLVAIFLSRSTFGIFICSLLLAKLIPFRRYFQYSIILLPLAFFVLVDEINYHLSYKLIGSDSFSVRYDRYLEFFKGDFINILFGYGNSYYLNQIAPFDLGGFDSFLQVSQRYGLIFVFFLFFLILFSNKYLRFPMFFIIIIGFFSQYIWYLPVIAFFYFECRGPCIKNNLRFV